MNEETVGNLFGNVAAHMREDLGELSLADWKMAPPEKRKRSPELDKIAAYSTQSRARLLRTAQNMETLGALQRNPDFARESCDIVQLMSDFCETASDLTEMLGVRLTFSCAESAHVCAIHPEYIRLCLGNLVSNAVKNSSKGGHARMFFQRPRSARHFLIGVEDNGSGIPPEKLPALFEEAWRNAPELFALRGSGLGLSVCKRVAEGHGGALTVESTPGKGSKFTMRIPDEQGLIKFRQPGFYEPNGGLNPVMIMLSDALPWEAFTIRNLL